MVSLLVLHFLKIPARTLGLQMFLRRFVAVASSYLDQDLLTCRSRKIQIGASITSRSRPALGCHRVSSQQWSRPRPSILRRNILMKDAEGLERLGKFGHKKDLGRASLRLARDLPSNCAFRLSSDHMVANDLHIGDTST